MVNPNLFNTNEEDIAKGLSLIDCLSSFGGYEFDPLALIKTVNYLHGLGADKSFQVLQLYCDIIDQLETQMEIYCELIDQMDNQMEEQPTIPINPLELMKKPDKVFMVARLLFIRKDGEIVLPHLQIGMPMVFNVSWTKLFSLPVSLFPLFPLYVYQDIPLSLVHGYMMPGGCPQPPRSYLDWCARECKLRDTPLQPSAHPLDSVDEFLKSEIWKNLVPKEEISNFSEIEFYRLLRLQALRAVSSAYPMSKQKETEFLYSTANEAEKIWRQYKQEVNRLNIFWNPVTNEYERG